MRTKVTTMGPMGVGGQTFRRSGARSFAPWVGKTDRSVGGTACFSGPNCIRIGHDVLSCAHARIGGWIIFDPPRRRRAEGKQSPQAPGATTVEPVLTPQAQIPRPPQPSGELPGEQTAYGGKETNRPKRRGRAADPWCAVLSFQNEWSNQIHTTTTEYPKPARLNS